MTVPIIIMATFSSLAVMASASRQLFAFARDRAVPFSPWIARVSNNKGLQQNLAGSCLLQIHPRFLIPVNALLVIAFGGSAINVVNIGSEVALHTILSLGFGAFSTAFGTCIACLLWRKLSRKPLLSSRFHLGTIGPFVNLFALGYLCCVRPTVLRSTSCLEARYQRA